MGDPQSLLSRFMDSLVRDLEMRNAAGPKPFDRQKIVGTTLLSGNMRRAKKRKRRDNRDNRDSEESDSSGYSSGNNGNSNGNDEDYIGVETAGPSDRTAKASRDRPIKTEKKTVKSMKSVSYHDDQSDNRDGRDGRDNNDNSDNNDNNGSNDAVEDTDAAPYRRLDGHRAVTPRVDPRVGFARGGRIRRRKGKGIIERALVRTSSSSQGKWRIALLSTLMHLRAPGLFATAKHIHFEICQHFIDQKEGLFTKSGPAPKKDEIRVFRPSDLLGKFSVLFAMSNFESSDSLREKFFEEHSRIMGGKSMENEMEGFFSALIDSVCVADYSSEEVRN